MWQCFGENKNGDFFKNGSLFLLYFEPLDRFDPSMAQMKALAGAITEMHCSIEVEFSTNSSKMHLGTILVNRSVRHNCGKIRENSLVVPQRDGSS